MKTTDCLLASTATGQPASLMFDVVVPIELSATSRIRSSGAEFATAQLPAPTPITVDGPTYGERLFDLRARFKLIVASLAMHLISKYRTVIYARLDELISEDEWEPDDELPTEQSFRTFLRFLIYHAPVRVPSIGADRDGHFSAAWYQGDRRLTLYFLEQDRIRGAFSHMTDDGRAAVALDASVRNLRDYLGVAADWYRDNVG